MTKGQSTPATPTSIYRYFDSDGVLIYVGITSRGIARNREHNGSKPWWPYVARQEVEHFADRPTAEQRERALIMSHRPPFNTRHNPDAGAMREFYEAFRSGIRDSVGGGEGRNRIALRVERGRTPNMYNLTAHHPLAQAIRRPDRGVRVPVSHGRLVSMYSNRDVVSALVFARRREAVEVVGATLMYRYEGGGNGRVLTVKRIDLEVRRAPGNIDSWRGLDVDPFGGDA